MTAAGMMAAAMNPNLTSADLCALIERDTEHKLSLLRDIEEGFKEIRREHGREAAVRYLGQSIPLLFMF